MEVVRMMKQKDDDDDDETPSVEPANISAEYLDRIWASVDNSSPLVLNQFEVDTAKFLLVALVSKVSNGLGSWTDFLSLQNNELADIHHKPYILASQLKMFRFLRAVCASSVLKVDLHTPEIVCAILGRDPGNVFGIWEDTESDEPEMFGWATSQPVSSIMVCPRTAQFVNLKLTLQIALQTSRNAAWIVPSNFIRCAMSILGKNFVSATSVSLIYTSSGLVLSVSLQALSGRIESRSDCL